jgi:splicing factor 3A subunit 3
VRDYFGPARGHTERLAQAHRVRAMLDRLQAQAGRLQALYADADGSRAAEIAALRGTGDGVAAFADRLAELRAFHARFPDAEPGPGTADPDAPIGGDDDANGGAADPAAAGVAVTRPDFSGEEAGGRCLDMHAHHRAWVNNPRFGPAGEYTAFVRGLAAFGRVPRPARRSRAWRDYLSALLSYLEGFFDRAHPLERLDRVYAAAGCGDEAAFAERFAAGGVAGWADRGVGPTADDAPAPAADAPAALPAPGSDLDLDAFDSEADLAALPPETLRDALAARGLKAGGTPAQRAQRLWLLKSTPLHALDRKHFAKGAAPPPPPPGDGAGGGGGGGAAASSSSPSNGCRAAAWLEARVSALVSPGTGALAKEVEATAVAVEQKQARTYEETAADAEEAGAADLVPSEDEDEDEYIYNPKDVPLGWDGKPIPYWLYKLHGLNRSFPCEICGGFVYRGRREFERHFREPRHASGMRALGIPNSKEFYEITAIDDARALWASIRGGAAGGGGLGGAPPASGAAAVAAAAATGGDEEVEDAEGNVYSRKVYEDLKRQGLL